MKIYAKTPQGSRFHGEIQGITFVRQISGDYVRWSDKSFCLNTSIINKLLDNGVGRLQFRYRMADKLKVYEIDVQRAFQIKPDVNEQGEENIRIPIEDCKLVKTTEY